MIDLNDIAPAATVPAFVLDLNDVAPPSSGRYDLEELSRRLSEQAGSWAPQLFPNGRQEGGELRLANIKGERPRKTGSCVIPLTGQYAGCFHDFDTGESGGPLKTLEHATGLTGRPLFDYAAGLVGLAAPKAQAPRTTAKARKEEDTAREIAFILSRTGPIVGTLAEQHLRQRGLDNPNCPDLLFHPDLAHRSTGTGYPAMVAIVRDAAGNPIGIHRTFLAPDGSGKALIEKSRMMLGTVAGGAVRLVPLGDGSFLGMGEGIETVLAVRPACPGLPLWSALSAGNLEQVVVPEQVTTVIIFVDNDLSGTGLKAALRAAAFHHAAGRRVWIVMPPNPGDDFDDLLMREGLDAVRTVLATAWEWRPEAILAAEQPEPAPEPRIGGQKPLGFQTPAGTLPALRADNGDLAEVTDRCWDTLRAANDPPWLFRCAAHPAWIERDDKGQPVPRDLTDSRLRHVLAQLITWSSRTKTGDLAPAYPPAGVVANLLATPDPDLPVLAGIVTAPVFGAAGELLTSPGYHPATELLYLPPAGFSVPPVPDQPSATEIAAARSLLLDDMLGDFPFVGEAERAHVLALLLLPFLRPMIKGPTPLHLIEKPEAGTGATLMVDAIAIVTTGSSVNVMVEGRDDEEWRKRLTAKLREIPSLVLIDNLRRTLDSAPLAAALTAPVWDDRILGKSENVHFPIRCTWIATGNNPQFSNEMARRLVRIRLDAGTDQPWLRDGFRHQNLLGWVRENRGRLVAACLILGRAWIAAGSPRHARTIGSFEEWSHVVGGVLDVAGVPGFLGNLKETYQTTNAEGSAQSVFIAAWWDRHGPQPVGTAELFDIAVTCDPGLPLGDGSERSQRTKLGIIVTRLRDRVFRIVEITVRLKALGSRQRLQQWALLPQDRAPERPASGKTTSNQDVGVPSCTFSSPDIASYGSNCDPLAMIDEPQPKKTYSDQCARVPCVPSEAVSEQNTAATDHKCMFNERTHQGTPGITSQDQSVNVPCVPSVPFSLPHTHTPARAYTHTPAHAHTREGAVKGALGTQATLSPGNDKDFSSVPSKKVPARYTETTSGTWKETI
ncbi:MAG: toprim domain-containing protein [Rhodospirillaceae bacterium]